MPQQKTHTMPLLAGFYFFYYATIGAFLPFWSLYLEKTGFAKSDIGLLMAVTMVARVFAPSVWGYLADATGKRMLWIRLATLAEFLAWIAIFWLPSSFMGFFVVMLFFSFFQNAIIPQFEAVTLFWLGSKRDNYGNIRLWGSVGFIVTVFGMGLLFDYISLDILPVVLAVLAMVCFINACMISEPHQSGRHKPTETHLKAKQPKQKLLETKHKHLNAENQQKVSYWQRLKTPTVAWFFLAQFVLLLSHAPFYSFYSNFLAEYGYSKGSIGFLWSVGVVAEILLFTQSKHTLAKFSESSLVAFCLLVTGIRWLLVAAFPTVFAMQFLAQCIHAFSFALFQSVAMQLIFREFAANQQGKAQALYSSFWGLGVASGSVVVGHFWSSTGGAFWFAVAGGMLLLFAVLYFFACVL